MQCTCRTHQRRMSMKERHEDIRNTGVKVVKPKQVGNAVQRDQCAKAAEQ